MVFSQFGDEVLNTDISTKYGYPSLGNVARYMAQILGVQGDNKKSFNKKLARLDSEQTSDLIKATDEVIEALRSDCYETLGGSEHYSRVVLRVLDDLHIAYKNLILNYANLRPTKEAVEYVLKAELPEILCRTIHKVYFGELMSRQWGLLPNDLRWMIPQDHQSNTCFKHALQHIYEHYELSELSFYIPETTSGKTDGPDYSRHQKIRRYTSKNATKSNWHDISEVLNASIDRLKSVESTCRRNISNDERQQILFTALVGYAASRIWRDIYDIYGTDAASKIQRAIFDLCEVLPHETRNLKTYINSIAPKIEQMPDILLSKVWLNGATKYWRASMDRANDLMTPHLDSIARHPCFNLYDFLATADEIGPYHAMRVRYNFIYRSSLYGYLECYQELIKVDPSAPNLEHLKLLDDTLCREDLIAYHPLANFIKAKIKYEDDEFDEAYGYAQKSFLASKYMMGTDTYQIFNLYVELCAKVKNKRAFDNALNWGYYAGYECKIIRKRYKEKSWVDECYQLLGMHGFKSIAMARAKGRYI